MNTQIIYQYEDGNGFKTKDVVVVEGSLTIAKIAQVMVDQDMNFDPVQVGLASLKGRLNTYPVKPPMPWHVMLSVVETEDDPTVEITADQLLAACQVAKARGWKPTVNRKRRVVMPEGS